MRENFRAAVLASGANPDSGARRRVSRRVQQQVLHDALHLGLVHRGLDRFGVDVDRPGVLHARGLHGAPDQGQQIGRASHRLHHSAVQSIQIEEVGEQPVELLGVGRDPADHVPLIVGRKFEVVAIERQREPEDRRQRRSQLVRHRVKERVLHLVQGPEPLRRFALAPQGALELVLGASSLGDVEHDALEDPSALHLDDDRFIPDPHDPAVLREHPILGQEWFAGLLRVSLGVHGLGAIVGVDLQVPRVVGGHPLLGGVPQDGLDVRADVGPGLQAEGGGVRDGRDLLDQRSVLRLGDPKVVLGPLALQELLAHVGVQAGVVEGDGCQPGEALQEFDLLGREGS